MKYLHVKNWSEFQHYKDRNPPWIKLHFSLLSSPDWVTLDDASRVLAIACMLIASRNHGQVPADPAYVKRVAYLNRVPNFKPLIDCGFLEDASECEQPLAEFRPEERRDRGETERATRLPADWRPSELITVWASKERPDLDLETTIAKFRDYWASQPGHRGRKLNWEATFRNWVRDEKPGRKTQQQQTGEVI